MIGNHNDTIKKMLHSIAFCGYDEFSVRAYPEYPGGTSLEHWNRELLRRALELHGFEVYVHEWWHFDYKEWRDYPILNLRFQQIR